MRGKQEWTKKESISEEIYFFDSIFALFEEVVNDETVGKKESIKEGRNFIDYFLSLFEECEKKRASLKIV